MCSPDYRGRAYRLVGVSLARRHDTFSLERVVQQTNACTYCSSWPFSAGNCPLALSPGPPLSCVSVGTRRLEKAMASIERRLSLFRPFFFLQHRLFHLPPVCFLVDCEVLTTFPSSLSSIFVFSTLFSSQPVQTRRKKQQRLLGSGGCAPGACQQHLRSTRRSRRRRGTGESVHG